jgi:uncharacterized protein (DUF1015 family)
VAEIRPFHGLHYNQSVVSDLSRVICPPYDVISPQLQQELYTRSEYNFIRIEFGRELPQDDIGDNRYTRSVVFLEDWLRHDILEVDSTPAFYLHDHYFQYRERDYHRRGLIVLVRLEEWDTMVVRPHEGTLAGPRRDRLDLLWTLEANTSPVLVMYKDTRQEISSLLVGEAIRPPMMRTSTLDGERHEVWAITAPDTIRTISACLNEQPLYIADGHHRYTSALTYRRERRDYSPTSSVAEASSGDEPFNFVMMTLVDLSDPGLIILAPHRLVRGISRPLLDGLLAKLEVFFEIERLPFTGPGIWQRVDELTSGTDKVELVCFGAAGSDLLLLRLRDSADIGLMMPSFHSPMFERLDVTITDHVVLEKLLEIDVSGDEARVAYCQDRQEAINRVLDGEYQLTFFLEPVNPELITAVADSGDTMPRKSTYFYPKTPVGLVFNRLV